jgi:lipopolysaccharide transport system ATP-binding protein
MPAAARIENLSKLYRIGTRQQAHYRTLRESLVDVAAAPWRRLQAIRNHSRVMAHELGAHARVNVQPSFNGPAALNGHAAANRHASSNGHAAATGYAGDCPDLAAPAQQNGTVPIGSAKPTEPNENAAQNGTVPVPAPDTIWALKDVSFDVQPGEVVGIIGRNGAGKSTLLKILSRITEPTSGRVELNGRVASLLEVGTGFHPELTGRENIYLNGAILGMRRHEIKRNFDAIVDFSGIETFLDTPVKRYSSGMYVRLAFAVAAHLDPEILIVDEVLAVGDAEFQKRCLTKMQTVARSGRTVLFVSHNMSAVMDLCDRAVLLKAGSVQMIGETTAAVNTYLPQGLANSVDGIVPDAAERIGTGEARVRRVVLKNSAAVIVPDLYLGESFRVALEYEALEPITNAHFGINVSTQDGGTLASAQTTDYRLPGISVSRGHHVAEACLDLILLPGEYFLDVGLHHENGATIDFVQRTLCFTVNRIAIDNKCHYPWHRVIGHVRPNASWSFSNMQPAEVQTSHD